MLRARRGWQRNQCFFLLPMSVYISRHVASTMRTAGYPESSSGRQIHFFVQLPFMRVISKDTIERHAERDPSRLQVFLAWTPATVTICRTRSMENPRTNFRALAHPRPSHESTRKSENNHLAHGIWGEARGAAFEIMERKEQRARIPPGRRLPKKNSLCRIRSPSLHATKTR